MNHSPQYHYKGDPDLDEYLSEYKNQTPLESDHYAGECYVNYYHLRTDCNRTSRNLQRSNHYPYFEPRKLLGKRHYVTADNSRARTCLSQNCCAADKCRFFLRTTNVYGYFTAGLRERCVAMLNIFIMNILLLAN